MVLEEASSNRKGGSRPSPFEILLSALFWPTRSSYMLILSPKTSSSTFSLSLPICISFLQPSLVSTLTFNVSLVQQSFFLQTTVSVEASRVSAASILPDPVTSNQFPLSTMPRTTKDLDNARTIFGEYAKDHKARCIRARIGVQPYLAVHGRSNSCQLCKGLVVESRICTEPLCRNGHVTKWPPTSDCVYCSGMDSSAGSVRGAFGLGLRNGGSRPERGHVGVSWRGQRVDMGLRSVPGLRSGLVARLLH